MIFNIFSLLGNITLVFEVIVIPLKFLFHNEAKCIFAPTSENGKMNTNIELQIMKQLLSPIA